MLKVRVIPTLLWKNFGLVKGVGFNSWRRVGSVLPSVKVYNQRDVDELVLVDITANGKFPWEYLGKSLAETLRPLDMTVDDRMGDQLCDSSPVPRRMNR